MRAIVSTENGPVMQDYEKPSVMSGYVLVKIRAASLNRVDLMMSSGGSHGAAGGIGLPLGVEWAGEIVELGEGVDHWNVGDRVMAAGPGAFSEYVIANAAWIYPIPDHMSFENAAALPVSLQTMHDAIASHGQLSAGQTILVQGASSAVGLMGVQIAKLLGASQVIGTSTSVERRGRLAEFGVDLAIDSRAPDWMAQVLKATKRKGVDLVVDLLAGSLVNSNLAVTKIGGRMVNVGRMAGESGNFDFDLHSMRRVTYVGVSFRTRSVAEITEVITQAKHALMPALIDGTLKMPVDKVYRFDDFASAFERMSKNEHFGKIVLSI